MSSPAPVLAALLLALSGPALLRAEAPSGGQLHDTRADLREIRAEISDNERTVLLQTLKEKAELGTLQRLNRELEAARRDASTHKHNLGLVQERLQRLQEAVDKLQAEEAADRAFLRADLVGLYKSRAGRQPLLCVLAPSPFETQARDHYLGALASATLRQVDSLGGDLGQLDSYRHEFDTRANELQRHMQEVEDDRRKVERERVGKEVQLRQSRDRKARAQEAVVALRRSADSLQGMLNSLQKEALRREAAREREREKARAEQEQEAEAQRQSGGRQESLLRESAPQEDDDDGAPAGPAGRGLRHGLPWPVSGEVLSEFGKHLHPVFHVPVFNRGIEIAAALGSPVRVVAAGRVAFAGEMDGFGHLVVVDHGEGMLSVYGYGSRLRVRKGQAVRPGDVLEDVGAADSSHQPALYFEIRRGVKAQDPLRYLARR